MALSVLYNVQVELSDSEYLYTSDLLESLREFHSDAFTTLNDEELRTLIDYFMPDLASGETALEYRQRLTALDPTLEVRALNSAQKIFNELGIRPSRRQTI